MSDGQGIQVSLTRAEASVMSADEVAELLGLSPGSVYAAARRGEIPCRRAGRRFIFWRPTMLTWLQGRDRDPHSEEA